MRELKLLPYLTSDSKCLSEVFMLQLTVALYANLLYIRYIEGD